MSSGPKSPPTVPIETCKACEKPLELCICSTITPQKNGYEVLILQHPQEPDRLLGSARIANLTLANSTLKVGLSWPNLTKALGRESNSASWGVLFLGGAKKIDPKDRHIPRPRLQILNKAGEHFDPEDAGLQGIVILDGTWAQAKTMWWRNPWLLKLKRIVINPQRRSLYGELRREPRRECLSTIEAIAETLEGLGEPAQVGEHLRQNFKTLLERYHETHGTQKPNK